MALLEECCDSVMSSAPSRFGFRPSGLWWHEQGELRRLLRALVSWECEQGEGDYRSFAQEVSFTLLLPGRTQPFFLRGYIDRIDRDVEGRVRIVDYKSGQSLYTEDDIRSGIAFQTALYALAAETLDEVATVRESYYLHLPIRKPSGALHFDGPVIEDGKFMEALDLASRFVERIQRGWFPSAPAKATPAVQECWSGCPYAALCRASWTGTRKARQLADADTPTD